MSTVYLSSDVFHAQSIPEATLASAIQAIIDSETRLVVQTIENPEYEKYLETLLTKLLGAKWTEHADLSVLKLLPYGRAETLQISSATQEVQHFPRCGLLGNPVFRYDGQISACCHEPVITGDGPDGLTRKGGSTEEIVEAYHAFKADPVLTLLNHDGGKTLSRFPEFEPITRKRYLSICDVCHDIQRLRKPENAGLALSAALFKMRRKSDVTA